MNKQVVILVNLTELYNILYEIKNFISFDIKNYANKDDLYHSRMIFSFYSFQA